MSVAVYFVQDSLSQNVKIGYANDVKSRIRQLQTGASSDLKLLLQIDGSMQLERRLHKKFAAFRISGEWFSPDKRIFDYIAKAKSKASKANAESWEPFSCSIRERTVGELRKILDRVPSATKFYCDLDYANAPFDIISVIFNGHSLEFVTDVTK